jgi:hypothetical protein
MFAVAALAALGIGLALAASHGSRAAEEARAVALQFFRTLDQRRYGTPATC